MADICEYCGGELETHDCVGLHADVTDCAEHMKTALAAAESRERDLQESLRLATATGPVWDKLEALAQRLLDIGEKVVTSPSPSAWCAGETKEEEKP